MKHFASLLLSSPNWESFISSARPRPSLAEGVRDLPHPAAKLLEELRTQGAPYVRNGPCWTQDQLQEAIDANGYGSTHQYLGFLEHELVDMIKKGYFIVLPFKLIKHMKDLRLSQAGIVPQHDRRPRTIIDYRASKVNDGTVPLAPKESMQFGRALDRILHTVLTANPAHGPVYLMKHDVADGFYRLFLNAWASLSLAMVMPVQPGEEPLVALPLALPMGWSESPPYFCAATETVVDLTNERVATNWSPPQHPLEHLAAVPAPTPEDGRPVLELTGLGPIPPPQEPTQAWEPGARNSPVAYFDVFVDDTIGVAQGSRPRLERLRRQLLHTNDEVFRPNDVHDQGRRDPSSLSKFAKGEATWSTYKTILGWTIDTLRGTIELPARRKARLLEILGEARHRKRISTKTCQKLLGELRSMVLGLPGGSGLFSQLQHALTIARGSRVRLKKGARAHLQDLYTIALDLARRPTRIAELFPSDPPHHTGTTDASGSGAGGTLLSSSSGKFWRWEYPPDIVRSLVTDQNPAGTISISDLELAATIIHEGVLAHDQDITEQTVRTGCDNIAAVAWRNKGSTTTEGPAAYLLRLASLQQRKHKHVPRVAYIAGPANVLADAASRRFDLSTTELISHLQNLAPQIDSWQELHVPPDLLSSVISALRQQSHARTSVQIASELPIPSGTRSGFPTSPNWNWKTIPYSVASTTKSPSYASSPNASEMDEKAAAVTQSQVNMWVTKSSSLQKRSKKWGPRTRV